MATKRITDVDIINSLDGNESFFVNKNNAIKQVKKENIVFGIANGGTGATTIAGARNALGLGNTSGALPIANGGTGATTVANARNALGLGNTSGALPVANGGTGATTAENARVNLGAVSMNTVSITLSASSWSSLSQTVSVTGVTANNAVFVNPAPNTSNYEAYIKYGVRCSAQTSGKLTFSCDETPTIAITVNIAMFS